MIPPLLEPAVIGPLALVGVGALVVLVGEVVLSHAHTFMSRAVTPSYLGVLLAALTSFFLCVAGVLALQQASWPEPVAFNPLNAMFMADGFSGSLSVLILLSSLLCSGLAVTYLDELDINHGEFYALVLFSTAGMLMLVSAVDLLTAYLGVELMSVPIYVLAGFDRTRLRSNEAGLKYFLLGVFASAIMLYGMALLYGVAGATSYEAIRAAVTPESPLALTGLGLVLVGLAFKIGAVPFHQWAPDVYEGSPSVVAAFISVGVTVASTAALLRVMALGFAPFGDVVLGLFWWIALLTLVVGSLMTLIQRNVKRLLAYGSIAQVGFMLIGVAAGGPDGYAAVVFYLLCYVFTMLGAFAVVVSLAHRGEDCEELSSFAGLARSRPGLAAVMAVFSFSLAGIPVTAGFMAKWRVASAAIAAGEMPLVVLGVLASVVVAYAFVRIPVLMYMREPEGLSPRPESTTPELFVLALCTAAVIYLGVIPDTILPTLEWAQQSVAALYVR
jgi:NADH-quinone oxidoreductase subunit N